MEIGIWIPPHMYLRVCVHTLSTMHFPFINSYINSHIDFIESYRSIEIERLPYAACSGNG